MDRASAFLTFVLFILFKNGFGQETICSNGRAETWVHSGDFCYLIYDEGRTWEKALQFCQEIGSNLASVHSAKEVELILAELTNNSRIDSQIWIGMRTPQNESSYQWSDGTETTYRNWNLTGNEEKPTKDQRCVYMTKTDGLWNTADCETQMQFICKTRSNNTSKSTEVQDVTVNNVTNICPSNWRHFGNKCYKMFGSEDGKKWQEAELSCVEQNGNCSSLLSVSNKTEEEYLTALLKDYHFDVWIGLQNEYEVKELNLIHGMDKNVTEETKNNNESVQNGQDCVAVTNSEHGGLKWSYKNCEMKKGYICQLLPSPSLTINTMDSLNDDIPVTGTINPGSMILVIMGSILGLFLLSTIGFIIYKRHITGQPHRLFAVRNRIFNHRRMDLQTLI